MPVAIRITEARASSTHTPAIHHAWAETMPKACAAAARWCAHHELAVGPNDNAPDRTLYLYDALGGLRGEVRRRDRKITTIKT